MTQSPRDARDRAHDYKEQREAGKEGAHPPRPESPRKPRSEAEFRDAVSQAIEEAMRQGEFDNLRGRGKPLDLNRDPFTPEGAELAYDIMRNNNVVPAWMGARAEIQGEIALWRERQRAIAARLGADRARTAADTWQRRVQAQRDSMRTEMEALNRRIRDVNLQQPLVTMEIFMLRLDEELRRAGYPEA